MECCLPKPVISSSPMDDRFCKRTRKHGLHEFSLDAEEKHVPLWKQQEGSSKCGFLLKGPLLDSCEHDAAYLPNQQGVELMLTLAEGVLKPLVLEVWLISFRWGWSWHFRIKLADRFFVVMSDWIWLCKLGSKPLWSSVGFLFMIPCACFRYLQKSMLTLSSKPRSYLRWSKCYALIERPRLPPAEIDNGHSLR
jgi:hypothetical protein